MPKTWLLIEVEDSLRAQPLKGQKLRYLVSPTLSLTEEPREEMEVVTAADDKGFEYSHCTPNYPGVGRSAWDRIESKVLAELRTKLGVNVRTQDVCITPLSKMTQF
jgi:hypothetical protein